MTFLYLLLIVVGFYHLQKIIPAKYIMITLAVLGTLQAVFIARAGSSNPTPAQPIAPPSQSPFQNTIAASGIIESLSENISVGPHMSGVVEKVLVKAGDKVQAGQTLFVLDARKAETDLMAAEAQMRLRQAEALEANRQWERTKKLSAQSLSQDVLDQRKFKALSAQAQFESAKALSESARVFLSLHTITAPIDGEVLSVKIRPGEIAEVRKPEDPYILIGNTSKKMIRADIDESDAWKVTLNAKAKVFLRGNPNIASDLHCIRLEPFVIPKRSLTGNSNERTDTRVLQVLYEITDSSFPGYIGQLVDVFIEGK